MALTDTLDATIKIEFDAAIDRSQTLGDFSGKDVAKLIHREVFTDGAGSSAATGFFSSQFTATVGGITVSLADSADPLAAAGDDVPTEDPEGKKLKALVITNEDTANFVSVKRGANGEASVFDGATDSVVITAGGMFAWTSPAGISAMNDGVDDEILITADTDSCVVKIAYLFG
jgi:hypothetical protein|tara:strand:- start:14614 stop:15135 length:522 start_codon:yes stop_codon:yes gene_type:complete